MKTNLYVLAIIVLSAATACENSYHQNTTDVTASAIVGGLETTKDNPTSRYMALIFDRPSESYCTAMLVRKNILLTAAHCIKSGPENMTLAFGNRPLAGQYTMREASRILVHPGYKKEQSVNRNDLALILVKGNAPEGYEALSIPDEQFPFRPGLTFTSAGYGRVTGKSDPRGNDIQGSGTLRHVELKIDSLSEDRTQFYVDQKSGKGICNGDSGGPAMMRLNGKDYVVGVASAISWIIPGELSEEAKKDYVVQHDICMHKSIYISTKKYTAWIEEGIRQLLQ
jgi:secreted trypsin-like serine protease